ncbi:hypothetical protein BDV97DRAFT_28439 [Delphinella strobiligena]|nr:hypothetical protein BDV97DRAFT_28439 [Delphinella strobiligena]
MAGPTLLELPREVRDQILEEVVSDGSLGDACISMRRSKLNSVNGNKTANFVPFVVAHHPVLAACKQLHEEGLDNLLRINTIKENFPLIDETKDKPGEPGFIDMLKQMGKDRAKKMSVGLMPPARTGREGGTVVQDEICLAHLKQAEQDWNIAKGRLFYEVRYSCIFLGSDAKGFLKHTLRQERCQSAFEMIKGSCTVRVICGDVAASLQKLEDSLQSFAVEYAGERKLDVNMNIIRKTHNEILWTMADTWGIVF